MLSEDALMQALHYLLPDDVVEFSNSIRNEPGMTFARYIDEIQTSHGSAMSLPESKHALKDIIDRSKGFLDLLDDVNDLLNRTFHERKALEDQALADLQDHVRDKYGSNLILGMISNFNLYPKQNFANFRNMCNTALKKDILKAEKERKVHQISRMEQNSLDDKIDSLTRDVRRIQNSIHEVNTAQNAMVQRNPVNAQSVKCFECKGNHFVRDCPRKLAMGQNRQASRGGSQNSQRPQNGMPYCKAKCLIHPGAQHRNEECKAQRGACQVKPNHSNHAIGDCRRPMGRSPPRANRSSFGQQGPNPNFSHQYPQQQNNGYQQNQYGGPNRPPPQRFQQNQQAQVNALPNNNGKDDDNSLLVRLANLLNR